MTLCCEEGQILTNFEALDKSVEIAKEREAHGFFLKSKDDGNIIAGFFGTNDDMSGEWISHDDCFGAIGFINDFNDNQAS